MTLRGVLLVDGADREGVGAPSALETVANRPIAHHVIDALVLAGVEELIVACSVEHAEDVSGSLAQCERRDACNLRVVAGPGPLGLRDALGLAAPIVGAAPCIVHLASGLIDEPIAPFVNQLRDAPDLLVMVHQGLIGGERLNPATQRMLGLAELDPERAGLRVAGACVLGPGAIERVQDEHWHGDGGVDLTSVGERLRAAGGSVDVALVNAWRRFRGDADDLLELNRIALDRLEADARLPQSDGNRIVGRVQVHPTAEVRASVVTGPTVIGPDARIIDSYIGPYTAVGARARVEGAEIERSIIADGACVMHVGGRMEGSVVGRDSRIFRDFSLPRALRVRGGERTEVAFF